MITPGIFHPIHFLAPFSPGPRHALLRPALLRPALLDSLHPPPAHPRPALLRPALLRPALLDSLRPLSRDRLSRCPLSRDPLCGIPGVLRLCDIPRIPQPGMLPTPALAAGLTPQLGLLVVCPARARPPRQGAPVVS